MSVVGVLEEGSCPHCGNDIFAAVDIDGQFTDGDTAFCMDCGIIGQVTCDEEGAYFTWDEIDKPEAKD